MLELLVVIGLILLSRTTIGDIISVSSLAKGLISRIGEKNAFGILKKAIDKTAREAKEAEIKEILDGLKGKEELLHKFRVVNEEAKGKLVSKYFKGRSDVLEQLAKNYYELFCKEATKKDRPFREFIVIELGKLANQGVITDEAVKSVESHLQGLIEDIKREKEAASRQFIITGDLKAVRNEILAGKPQIEYVERKELEKVEGALETTNKLLVVGKPGAGKSRFLLKFLEVFNGYERFVVIRSFFREDGISSLDAELQQLNSFILIWDDLHRAKDEIVNQTINQIEQLAKEYGKEYLFIGVSRMEGKYYQFKQEEIKLDDFRSLELIEKCSTIFGVSAEGVKKKLLAVGDGTPFYVISLFATSKERGKRRLTEDDLKALPDDSFKIWHDHLNFLESEGRLSTSEKNVLRSIALAMMAVPAIDFEVLEKFYEQIFRGDLSEFDYALDEVVKKFFIGMGGELCSMHAVQAAVVDEKYPVEERKIDRLKDVITALERDKCLILLWGFAHWFHASKKYGDCLKFMDVYIEKEPNIVVSYSNRGIAYMGLKQHERAIEDYNKAIELNPNLAWVYCNRGIAYAGLKQHERAIEDYNKAIKMNPNLAWAYYNRGISYAELKEHEQAIKDYNKAIELNPNLAWAYCNRGTAYIGLKEHEQAIEDYNKVIKLNPDDAEAYCNRGIAYCGLKQHELAIKDYSKAIELNPNFAEAYGNRGNTYLELKEHELAIKDYNKAIKLNWDDAKAYYNRGTAYVKLKQYERAIKDYNSAIELNSNYAEAYDNRGNAYAGLSQHEIAIEDYNKAIELNLNYAEAYYNRGTAYVELKQHERAIKDYNSAIELNPNFAEAYNNRGAIHHGLNKHERAIQDFNKAIELNPDHAEAYNNRGAIYHGLNKHEQAIEDYNKAIKLNLDDVKAYYNRASAYYELKKYEQAIEDYNKVIKLNPDVAEAYTNRGIAYCGLKQQEQAIKDYNKAIELNPDVAEAYANRASAYYELKKYEQAIEDYNSAIELNPDGAEVYYNRGTAYYNLKQHERAIKDYNKAIELNLSYAKAYLNRGTAYYELKQHERAIEDYNKAIELNPNLTEAYVNRGMVHSKIGRSEEAARNFKKAGVLFIDSVRFNDSVKAFSFDMREEIESEDVLYCGLALFLMTKKANMGDALRRMQIQDETMRKIFELAHMKLQGDDISDEIARLEKRENRK